jgi:signal transduction histidine kinase
MGISLAVAVLRYSLFGIDRLVNRTLVYDSLTLCVVAVYMLVVGYLIFLFQTEANLTISLIATGIVAVLFDRFRLLLQRGVNRFMYGERDEPYQVLTRLGQQLENALEPSIALSLTAETVAQTLKLLYPAVFLKQNDAATYLIATFGMQQPDLSWFPLVYGGEAIGDLVVGQRSPDEPLTPPDHRLLTDLARQIVVMAHAAQLTTDLETARLRIVTERSEARRRLGIDLHDRVGHQLVGLTRQLEQLVAHLPSESTHTGQSLADACSKITAVIHYGYYHRRWYYLKQDAVQAVPFAAVVLTNIRHLSVNNVVKQFLFPHPRMTITAVAPLRHFSVQPGFSHPTDY